MTGLARGQVVLLPFPFSDLSASKLRPALVVADADRGDWLLCQITSKPYSDANAVTLLSSDFEQGGLQRISYARPAKLFTAHESLVTAIAGNLNRVSFERVCDAVVSLVKPVN